MDMDRLLEALVKAFGVLAVILLIAVVGTIIVISWGPIAYGIICAIVIVVLLTAVFYYED